ncbi:MAG: hypothetical protein K2M43_01400, partial [Mycoplasmoidaceae bacterium]|nr:hypothetical protein [Mycoplasmoidaceae bacterium]
MFATTLGGSAGICYATSKKIEYGSEFEKSYNIRFELDPYANEDPNQDATNVSLDEVKEKLNQAVDSYSYYLDQKGIEVSDIYPEVYETTEGTTSTVHAYINAVVPNIKVTDKDDDKEKIDMSPAEVYFSDIYSPRLSIFYHADKNADYVINKDYLVNDDDDIMLPSNSYDNAIY